MCGIAGIATTDHTIPDRNALARMKDCLVHRGPDDEGDYLEPGIALGFRRLSIIDLSLAGHQPMTNEDGSLWLVFNGEIYNFQELRDELTSLGHVFRSQTDSETVLHAYEAWGERCVEQLRGMFAFAIWDEKRRTLFLARDRFGKKPLFYTVQGGTLFFASELAALLRAVERPPLNTQAITYYFRLQFIPSPHTIFQGIHKLPPAHAATWREGRLSVQRYWSLSFLPKTTLSFDDAGKEFERLFREAVTMRLMSDVPLGVFLSGGLDSSVITALMAQASGERVKTFSIGFEEESHNELPLARLVAERYNTDHHEMVVRPDVVDILPKLMRHYGEPFADSSAIATYCVARETRQFVTVVLSGDGGDENFAGYDKYTLLTRLARFDKIPSSLRTLAGRLARLLTTHIPTWHRKAIVGSSLLAGNLVQRYLDLFFVFRQEELKALLTQDVLAQNEPAELLARRIIDSCTTATTIDRITALDLQLYLPEGLMTKADIATMANSLEARSPFLDHHVVEFTTRLPDEYKMAGSTRKLLLRRQFGHLLPKELLAAPKHGFDLPVNQWLRGTLKQYFLDRMTDTSFRTLPYFNHTSIQKLTDEHMTGRIHHGIKLWSLLCFAIWYEEMMR